MIQQRRKPIHAETERKAGEALGIHGRVFKDVPTFRAQLAELVLVV